MAEIREAVRGLHLGHRQVDPKKGGRAKVLIFHYFPQCVPNHYRTSGYIRRKR
jgi:hypothetical protein